MQEYRWFILVNIVMGCLLGIVLIIFSTYIYGAVSTPTDYVGTNAWLIEVDKCVDLYQETEQNETLYYGCMNKLGGK